MPVQFCSFGTDNKIVLMDLYTQTCFECSKLITKKYSTSFSSGIRAFDKKFRYPVYAIYGFVRAADEIVDTFHTHNRHQLIAEYRADTFKAIDQKISLNPVLHSFQAVVNEHNISIDLIDAFLMSMEMDLDQKAHDIDSYNTYVFGSSEVVGLMCLKVFCGDDELLYKQLQPNARSLGSAFQKVNFLRDIQSDMEERGRVYFPDINFSNFTEQDKKHIEANIQKDFNDGFDGIKQLPNGTRLGVYIAYIYYLQLFKKITNTSARKILKKRIRVSDTRKLSLYCKAIIQQKLNLI
jgi:phytoene synthase